MLKLTIEKLRAMSFSLFVLSALICWASTGTARAVVLEQQWKAGQQLSYDMALNGTLNLQMAKNSNSLLAGIPLQVIMQGTGQTTLNTLQVNEFGQGTVAVLLNQMKMKAEGFGQVVDLEFQDGQARLLMNGQPVEGADKNIDWTFLQNPPLALRLSKQMRFEGMVPVEGSKDSSEKDKAKEKAEDNKSEESCQPKTATVQYFFISALFYLRTFYVRTF